MFASEFNFKPVYSSPMYPQSNGQAERTVQTLKKLIKKANRSGTDISIALLAYRNAKIPHLDASPAQLLMSRVLRSKLPIIPKQLKPKVVKSKSQQIKMYQRKQKHYYDTHHNSPNKTLQTGMTVRYRTHENKWATGCIVDVNKLNKRDYTIQSTENKAIRRNRVHVFGIPRDTPMDDSLRGQVSTQRETSNYHYTTRYGRTIRPVDRLGY